MSPDTFGPIVWQPAAAPLPLFGIAAFLVALALWAYSRTLREHPWAGSMLLAMRVAMIGAVTILLLGPSRLQSTRREKSRPTLSVLVDTSESMRTEDDAGVSRLETARRSWFSPERLTEMTQDFSLEINQFDDSVRPLPRERLAEPMAELANGRFTYLVDAVSDQLSRIATGQQGAALLLLSDGRDTNDSAPQAAAALARARDLPIYSVLIGRDSFVNDVAVLGVPMQDYLLPGESGSLLIKVHQSGLGTATTQVHVSNGDQKQSFVVAFNGQSVVELQAPIRHDEPGQFEYTVTVDPVDGESILDNNEAKLFCDVHRKRLKVLLLEGAPYWDTKFLAQSLRKDERIELVQISQISSRKRETILTRNETGAARLPQSADEWAAFDLVILGRGMEAIFGEKTAEQLLEFVSERGGHLVFARGRCFSRDTNPRDPKWRAMPSLEPVEWSEDRPEALQLRVAPAGRLNPWLASTRLGVNVDRALETLSGFETIATDIREKPATIVLARAIPAGAASPGPGVPALVQMNVGRGSVVAVTGQGLWRWSLLSNDDKELSGFYDSFWSNLARWMTMGGDFPPGEQVSLKLARTTSRLGDPLMVEVVCKQPLPAGRSPELTLIDEQGRRRKLLLETRPGREPRYQATIEPTGVGVYSVDLRTPGLNPESIQRRFSVYDVNEERLNTQVDPASLKALADQSGGAFFEWNEFDRFWQRLKRHEQSLQIPPRTEYLWDRGLWMTLLMCWVGAEWILRRQIGLL